MIVVARWPFLLLSVFLLITLKGTAQTISYGRNSLRDGDGLVMTRAHVWESTEGGTYIWAVENSEKSEEVKRTFRVSSDSCLNFCEGKRVYYRQSKKALFVTGYESPLYKIKFSQAENRISFPMCKGDSIEGRIEGNGLYCDKIPIHLSGNYKAIAGKSGKMLLPDGGVALDVLCLQSMRSYHVSGAADTIIVRQSSWFASGFRYPLLEHRIVLYQDSVASDETLFCNPHEQPQLALDESNTGLLRDLSEKLSNEQKNETQSHQYSISSTQEKITATNYETKEVYLRLALSNAGGIEYRNHAAVVPANGNISISCSGLPSGQYIIYVSTNGQVTSEKYVKK